MRESTYNRTPMTSAPDDVLRRIASGSPDMGVTVDPDDLPNAEELGRAIAAGILRQRARS